MNKEFGLTHAEALEVEAEGTDRLFSLAEIHYIETGERLSDPDMLNQYGWLD